MAEPVPHLTKWQQRRRDGKAAVGRLTGILFAVLAIAMMVYFGALTRLVAPVLID